MAVAVDYVVTPIVFSAKVDIGGINNGNAPMVVCYDIISDVSLVVLIHTIDADAAAAIHRISFQFVVNELVADNDGTQIIALLVVTVAAVFDDIVFQ